MELKTFLFTAVYQSVNISKEPFHEAVFKFLQEKPDRVALVNGQTGFSITFKETESNIRKIASAFRRLGVRHGDIIAIFSPNNIEYVYSVFASMANGAAASTVNPSYTQYELEHALKLTNAKWWVTVPKLNRVLQEAIKNSKVHVQGVIVIDSDVAAPKGTIPFSELLLDDGSFYPSNVKIDSERDAATIMFSSGTTGLPKGVMLSHYNITAMLSILGSFYGSNDPQHAPDEQPVTMIVLPLYHCYGLIGIVFNALIAAHKLIMLPRFVPEETLISLEKYQVTVFPMVPPIVVHLCKSPLLSKYSLNGVRRFLCGAAPLALETQNEFKKVTNSGDIAQGFGMTETTLAVLLNTPGKPIKTGSCGQVLPNTEVKVVDITTNRELNANEKGEICCRGPQIMMGYLNNEAATQATIDLEGWLHTGDIGYYDEEGYFFVIDRIKELIKYKGFQVAPAELESLILSHPDVDDVAVIGIPNEEAGELPKAFVVAKRGAGLTSDSVKQFVADKMSNYKHLRGGVEFLDKIPKSEAGKILRRELRLTTGKSKL